MEIVKQSKPQTTLFEQHDRTTILSLLIFCVLSQSHRTKLTDLKYIIYITYSFYLLSTLFFLHCMIKYLRQMKKIVVYLTHPLVL